MKRIDAIRNGDAGMVRSLLNRDGDVSIMEIQMAVAIGNMEVIVMLMQKSMVNADYCLKYAVMYQRVNVARWVLRSSPDVNPTYYLKRAIMTGPKEMIKLLMGDVRTKPTEDHWNLSARMGVDLKYRRRVRDVVGDTYLLREVLKEEEPDEDAMCMASARGYLESVKVLMSDGRVNPACRGNMPLKMARKKGHVYVVLELLRSARVREGDNVEDDMEMLEEFYRKQIIECRDKMEYVTKEHLREMCRYNPRLYDKNLNADMTKEEQIDQFVELVFMNDD